MTVYHNHIAVIGRADGDDEDSVHLLENCTVEQAKLDFDLWIREASDVGPDHDVYINYVLVSPAPITILETNV